MWLNEVNLCLSRLKVVTWGCGWMRSICACQDWKSSLEDMVEWGQSVLVKIESRHLRMWLNEVNLCLSRLKVVTWGYGWMRSICACQDWKSSLEDVVEWGQSVLVKIESRHLRMWLNEVNLCLSRLKVVTWGCGWMRSICACQDWKSSLEDMVEWGQSVLVKIESRHLRMWLNEVNLCLSRLKVVTWGYGCMRSICACQDWKSSLEDVVEWGQSVLVKIESRHLRMWLYQVNLCQWTLATPASSTIVFLHLLEVCVIFCKVCVCTLAIYFHIVIQNWLSWNVGPAWRIFFIWINFTKRVIIQVQSFIIKCLSFRQVSFTQGYRLHIEKLCTWITLPFYRTI